MGSPSWKTHTLAFVGLLAMFLPESWPDHPIIPLLRSTTILTLCPGTAATIACGTFLDQLGAHSTSSFASLPIGLAVGAATGIWSLMRTVPAYKETARRNAAARADSDAGSSHDGSDTDASHNELPATGKTTEQDLKA